MCQNNNHNIMCGLMDIINESMHLPKACLKWKKTGVTQKPSTSYIQPSHTVRSLRMRSCGMR